MDYIDAIAGASISNMSKKVYLTRLKKWVEEAEVELETILANPDKYLKWVYKKSSNSQTQKSYISAILAIFKHTPELKDKYKSDYDIWFEAFKKVNGKIEDKYKTNEPSERQKEGFVEYKEIIQKRDHLEKGSKERLLLAMYTYLPPLRSDFNKVYIYTEKPSRITQDNYILLYDTPKIVLKEYKTSKNNKILENPLPKELIQEIKDSLAKEPREWLFMDRTKGPYKSTSFNKWANRVFLKLFERPLTISLIRHSFVNQLNFNTLSIQDKEDIAKCMAHTVTTQDRYRLIFKKD
jgi:integrase